MAVCNACGSVINGNPATCPRCGTLIATTADYYANMGSTVADSQHNSGSGTGMNANAHKNYDPRTYGLYNSDSDRFGSGAQGNSNACYGTMQSASDGVEGSQNQQGGYAQNQSGFAGQGNAYGYNAPGNYNQNPGNYNQNPGNYNQHPGNYNQNPGNYNQNPGSYNQNPGGYYHNQQPPVRPAAQKKQSTNVLPIIGFILCFIPGMTGISLFLCIAGLLSAKRYFPNRAHKGLAIAGIVLNIIFALFYSILILFTPVFEANISGIQSL